MSSQSDVELFPTGNYSSSVPEHSCTGCSVSTPLTKGRLAVERPGTLKERFEHERTLPLSAEIPPSDIVIDLISWLAAKPLDNHFNIWLIMEP
jgi:hypothetical protein